MVTFDAFFDSLESYQRVMAGEVLTTDTIAQIYGVELGDIVNYAPLGKLLALKFTMRRSRSSGSPGDSDIFGAQQYAPLLDLVIP